MSLHTLSVEVARLRTLADHSYTAINDLLVKADAAECRHDLVIESLYHLLGACMNKTVGQERRVMSAMFSKVGKVINHESVPEDDPLDRLGFDLGELRAVVQGIRTDRRQFMKESGTDKLLRCIVADLRTYQAALKESGH